MTALTGGEIEIRPFSMADYDAVFALWRQCEGIGLSQADSRDSIRHYLKRNPGMSFVASSGDVVVGAVLCGHDGRRGYIHHLAVHSDYRRRSLGRRLVEHCLQGLGAAVARFEGIISTLMHLSLSCRFSLVGTRSNCSISYPRCSNHAAVTRKVYIPL